MKSRFTLVLFFGLFLMACGLLQGLSQVQEAAELYITQMPQTLESQRPTLEAAFTQMAERTQASPEEGEAQPTASAQAGGEAGVNLRDYLSAQEQVRSGRERLRYIVTVGEQSVVVMEWLHEFVRETQAESWTVQTHGQITLRLIRMQDTYWLLQEEGSWVRVTITDPNDYVRTPLFNYLSPETWTDLQWQRVGEETVNGIEAVRYRSPAFALPPSTLQEIQIPGLPPLMGPVNIEQTVAEVWVTPEGYVVRGVIRWEGQGSLVDGNQVRVQEELMVEVFDINQPITIEAPQAAQQAKPPFPVPQEAVLVMSLNEPPSWIYNVPDWSPEQGAQYVRETAPSHGFQILEDISGDTTTQFVLQGPDGRVWTVLVQLSATRPTGIDLFIQERR